MAINIHNLRVSNMTVGPLSGGGNGGGGGSSEPSYLAVGAHRFGDDQGRVYVYDTSNYSTAPIELSTPVPYNGAEFGISSTFNTTSLIVGAQKYNATGAILAYSLSDLTATPTVLSPSDVASSDYFGSSVAATDSFIVAGAYFHDAVASNAGAAYVYDATNLSATPTKLTPSGIGQNDGFGQSTAVNGNQIVVGAWGDDDQGENAGAVYVYDATNLSATPTKITAYNGNQGDQFGYSTAFSDNYLFIGAPESGYFGQDQGQVYVYDRNNLSNIPTILAPLTSNSNFGKSISVSSNYLVVGDPRTNSSFVYDISNLSTAPTQLTTSGLGSDLFGHSVGIKGTQIAIGAKYDDTIDNNSGAVYIYDANNLSATPTKLAPSNLGNMDEFGESVSLG